MGTFYSATTKGFHISELGEEKIPTDAVSEHLWAYTHAELLVGENSGKLIVPDANGYPVLIDDPSKLWTPEPTLTKVREAREVVLNRLSGIAFAAMNAGDQTTVSACLTARTDLLNLTTLPSVASAIDELSLTTALKTAYAAIVLAAPLNLKTAFRGFDL